MQNRILSVLCATVTGAILVAAAPARAASDLDADLFYRDALSDQYRVEQREMPRSLSFKFASLYNRIMDTAARIADFTHLDRTTMSSPGIGIGFQSLDPMADVDQLDPETTRRLIPGIDDEPDDGFSLRVHLSDDHAPLVDPSPRKPSDPIKDKIWLALGARYHHSERLSVDIGYEHLWVNETTFDRPGGIGSDIMGDYRSELDLIGARLRWAFD
ncbi:MAG TPA: outer membrane protein transport protein [Gammaproteobacteria bacterium]|nr:outer membrane protein transport protein [Gammaproteobacteria bacterium]